MLAMEKQQQKQGQGRQLSFGKTVLICAVLILVGAATLWLIFSTEPVPQRESAVRETAMLVEVASAEAGSFRPLIEATGVVRPAREILLRPRISGEVVELSDAFVPGGFVDEGDLMLRIDEADFRIALNQRESELQQAIALLEIEHGRQDIAERDYRQLGKSLEDDNRSLVLREPQLRSAEAGVQSARSVLEQARLELGRARITAPFDAQILSRDVNLGSQVSTGDTLARLVGLEQYWVETTVSLDRLRWLSFSGQGGEGGSDVTVRHRTAWAENESRSGRLYRLVGELEGDTRMARVLVTVDDPLAHRESSAGLPPLLIGSFVHCVLEGREIENVVKVERKHVRKDDTAWVMKDGLLEIRQLEVVFQDAEHAYVRDGLKDGDQVVTTSLSSVREGAALRLKSSEGS